MNIRETNFKFSGVLSPRTGTNYIVLHHRAGDGDVNSIHSQHLGQGYAGIGYHFYVRKDGSVYRGRPVNTIGAHCLNYNRVSVGVCFEGNFENEQMSEVQLNAGIELVRYLKGLYPNASIVGHKDLMSTACPGRNCPMEKIKGGVTVKKKLESANDITWELNNSHFPIEDTDGFVKALDKAKQENSPLYWGYYKLVNK